MALALRLLPSLWCWPAAPVGTFASFWYDVMDLELLPIPATNRGEFTPLPSPPRPERSAALLLVREISGDDLIDPLFSNIRRPSGPLLHGEETMVGLSCCPPPSGWGDSCTDRSQHARCQKAEQPPGQSYNMRHRELCSLLHPRCGALPQRLPCPGRTKVSVGGGSARRRAVPWGLKAEEVGISRGGRVMPRGHRFISNLRHLGQHWACDIRLPRHLFRPNTPSTHINPGFQALSANAWSNHGSNPWSNHGLIVRTHQNETVKRGY